MVSRPVNVSIIVLYELAHVQTLTKWHRVQPTEGVNNRGVLITQGMNYRGTTVLPLEKEGIVDPECGP